jgi:type II secretory pathway pseudopilin PulG
MILIPALYKTNYSKQHGFSYVEVLLSVVLIAVLLVPAMQSLNGAISGSATNVAARQLNLRNKMEEVLSKPYGTLYAVTSISGGNTATSISTSLSDASGSVNRRAVTIYRYDTSTNALSATDTGVLFVSVYYEADSNAIALNTLVGQWW